MITRLSVRDFQAIQAADLDLAPVTLICGHNSAGKSAILRALHSLCFNRTGDSFIREGEDEAIVSVMLSEEPFDAINWTKRRKESASYWRPNSEQRWVKTGSAVPEPITDALKVRRIEVDSTFSIAPQFRMQHDTLLIKESGSRLARILGSLTKLDVVVKAQMLCRRDRDRAKRDKETAEQEAERLNEQLAGLDWVAGARQSVDDITATLTLATQVATKHERVRELMTTRVRLLEVVKQEEPVRAAQEKLKQAALSLEWAHDEADACERGRVLVGERQRLQGVLQRSEGVGQAKASLERAKELAEILPQAVVAIRQHEYYATKIYNLETHRLTAVAEAGRTEEVYREACDDAELCSHCPLREGV